MTLGSRVLAGRYRLEDVLGQGGMAIVYRAQDTALGRPVAVKVLREQFSADPEFLERFRREARAAAGLSHPNIVAVFDVGREGATNFIVMEYVEGEDLKELIRREGPLPSSRLINLGCQLAAALEYAHRHDLVHRDIKSHNVLVTRDDQLKVGDFGIAVALGARSITQAGMVIGSVHYMAPEQARGQPPTRSTDIYALGVVLYEMATGQLPFVADSQLAVATMQIDRPPTPPLQCNPHLPPAISEVILKALAKDPGERFQSAAEVAAALRGQQARAAQRTVVVSRGDAPAPPDRTRRLVVDRTISPTVAAPAARARTVAVGGPAGARAVPRRRSRAWLLIPLAVLVGGIGAAAGWFYGTPTGPARPQPTPAPVVIASPSATAPPATSTPAPAKPKAPPTATPAPPTATPPPPTPTPPPPTATPAPPSPVQQPTAQPTAPPKPAATPPSSIPRSEVPSLVGRNEIDAIRALAAVGLAPEVREDRSPNATNGVVLAQSPGPGTSLERGRRVTITVGRPPNRPPAKKEQGGLVPNVEGMDEREARRTLQDAGFRVRVEEETAPDRKGQVVNQNPGAGDTAPPETTVTISIGA